MTASVAATAPPENELSVRAVVLGLVLSVILSAANAYLGLFAGMTVSASIPAAVLSMGILRAMRGGILENNLVQTAASAGESAAAGAIFTLPALVLLGAWHDFPYGLCMSLVLLGGLLGVLFTIFLRGPLVVSSGLAFPEGVATAHVLRVGHSSDRRAGARGLRGLVWGSCFGAVAKVLESALGWSKSVVEVALPTSLGHFYLGTGTAPALVAVGHIVGRRTATLIFAGGVVNWVCVLPFVTESVPGQSPLDVVWQTWSEKTRYLGVGAMTVGGLGALFSVRQSLVHAVSAGWRALRGTHGQAEHVVPARERDLPHRLVLGMILASVFPLCWLFVEITGSLALSVLITVLVIVFGFLFSSVAGYMAGLVGSSNNPVSGVTIATIVLTSLLLSALGVEALAGGVHQAAGPAAAILVGTIVCTAAAIGGDNLQDLKAGQILGATPARQQVMQLLGVVAAALVMAPVLSLLLDAYGFGPPTEAHPRALRAPQATLMASVAEGVFGGALPFRYVAMGAALAVVLLVWDELARARKSNLRVPPLAVALGLYLPWEMSGPLLLGAWWGGGTRDTGVGLLTAAGLITGEALFGILWAVLVASGSAGDFGLGPRWESGGLGLLVLLACVQLLRMASRQSASLDAPRSAQG